MPNLAKLAGGTLKSYLNSLHMFIQFVVNRRPRPGFPTLTPEVQEIFQEVLASLKGWQRTITKEKSSARYTRILAETERYANLNAICSNFVAFWLLPAALVE